MSRIKNKTIVNMTRMTPTAGRFKFHQLRDKLCALLNKTHIQQAGETQFSLSLIM